MAEKNRAVVPASLAVIFRPGSKELGVTARGTAAIVLAVAFGFGLLVAVVLAAMKLTR